MSWVCLDMRFISSVDRLEISRMNTRDRFHISKHPRYCHVSVLYKSTPISITPQKKQWLDSNVNIMVIVALVKLS